MSEHDDRQPWRAPASGPDDTSRGSDLPESLGLWLEGGPSYLSASTRQAILAGARVTRQAQRDTVMLGLTRERVRAVRWLALAAALVVLAVLGAVLATAGRPTVQELPAVAPVPAEASDFASLFRVPFRYQLPEGAGLQRYEQGEGIYRWDSSAQRSDGAGPQATLVIRTIGQRYVNPCDGQMGIGLIEGGMAGTVAYLRSIPGLKTSDVSATKVDGQPASQLTIQLAPTADCPVVWTWPERLASLNDGLLADQAIRFTITKIGEQLVAIGAITTATDMDSFAPTADAFIASLRFDHNHPDTARPMRTYVPGASAASIGPGRLRITAAGTGATDGNQLLSEQDAATQRLIASTPGIPPETALNMAAAVTDAGRVLIGMPRAGKIIELDQATGQEVGHVILSQRVITSVAWARPLDDGAFGDDVWIGEPDGIEKAGLKSDAAGFVFQHVGLWDGATVIAMIEGEPADFRAVDLWALASDPCTLLHIDAATLQVLERLPLGGSSCPQGRLAVSGSDVWVRTNGRFVLVQQDGG